MADEKLDVTTHAPRQAAEYHAPEIEEVVTRDKLEREAAYAGTPAPSRLAG